MVVNAGVGGGCAPDDPPPPQLATNGTRNNKPARTPEDIAALGNRRKLLVPGASVGHDDSPLGEPSGQYYT